MNSSRFARSSERARHVGTNDRRHCPTAGPGRAHRRNGSPSSGCSTVLLSMAPSRARRSFRPTVGTSLCSATGPTIFSAMISGRSTGRPANGRCWSIPKSSAADRPCPRRRRCSASARARSASKGIVTYDWSPDGKSILVPLEGQLYLAGVDGNGRQVKGTGKGDPLNPVLSETGKYLSFVRDNRLWAGQVGSEIKPITPKEGELVHWGEAEFVAQEELDRLTGYWWSPKDNRIAVERFDESPVAIVTRAAIGAAGTKTYQQRYPAAGGAQCRCVALRDRPERRRTRSRSTSGPNRDIYLAARRLVAGWEAPLRPARESRANRTRHARRSIPRPARASCSSARTRRRATGSI